jgi:hypothetical protein
MYFEIEIVLRLLDLNKLPDSDGILGLSKKDFISFVILA